MQDNCIMTEREKIVENINCLRHFSELLVNKAYSSYVICKDTDSNKQS